MDRPTGYLSNKTLGCTLAHRAMPADSCTKYLRNVKQASEGRRLWSLLIVAVIGSVLKCQALCRTWRRWQVRSWENHSWRLWALGKYLHSSTSPLSLSFSLSVLKHMPLSKGSNSGPQASFLKRLIFMM